MRVRVKFASAVFEFGDEWSITVRGNHVYDRLSGPEHRLDISMHAKGTAAAVGRPHGAGCAHMAISAAHRCGPLAAPSMLASDDMHR